MRRLAWALIALPVVGAGVAASGVMPLRASAGHWGITEAILRFSSRRSIATWSAGIEVPPLGDPRRGAGHYDRACRACHGAPGEPPSPVARAMLPPPPDLAAKPLGWDAEDVFYVVKHGVKFTPMPPWPAQTRDDEIWPIVAFLELLPSLDAAAYADMVGPEGCAGCHGEDGLGPPRLAGQSAAYLEASLRAFASGDRPSAVMSTALHGVPPERFAEIAARYAEMPPGPPIPAAGDRARGEALARGRRPDVPGCVACHGPAEHAIDPAYPSLVRQDPGYVAAQMALFRAGLRGGTAEGGLMEAVASHGLDEAEVRDVAAWYAAP